MSEHIAADRRAQEPPKPPPSASWHGDTYYDRPQLKAAPFNAEAVGAYIFLAGLSGAAALIATVADLTRGEAARPLVRRGRLLSMLAPILGAPLLVWDLHTPTRFYNMLRIAKPTSPMSIGTWILMAFTGFAGATAAGEVLGGVWRRLARIAQVPAALTGAGLATYTAALLSATSTPLWAAAPRALAVRFGGSALAAGAAALALGERSGRRRRDLDTVALAGLAAELAGIAAASRTYRARGVSEALHSPWGRAEEIGADGFGALLPFGVLLANAARGRPAPGFASVAILAGSALLRIAVIAAGEHSATDPDVSFRFASPQRNRQYPSRAAAAASPSNTSYAPAGSTSTPVRASAAAG